jgi:hypothetical protein
MGIIRKTTVLLSAIFFVFVQRSNAQTLPDISQTLNKARIYTRGDSVFVSTGEVERKFYWTGNGLVTDYLKDLISGKLYSNSQGHTKCDWNLQQKDTVPAIGTFISMIANVSDDEGFTNKFIEITTQIRYESLKLEIQHVIWVFPGAPGIRTQLRIKSLDGFEPDKFPFSDSIKKFSGSTQSVPGGRSEYLPLDFSVRNSRRYWGYFNDPGNRHDQSKDMLKEEVVKGYPLFRDEVINWASGIGVEYGDDGVCLIKESNKCVNQQGHDTGSFYSGPNGLSSTGLGLLAEEISRDRFRECWANWTILYRGGNDGMQLAVKRFDRARYPVFPQRDLFILANTWGPANPGGTQFTDEKFILREIPALANLGIDVFQIDDGWQKKETLTNTNEFLPKYTNGWKDIKSLSDRYNIKPGLWVSIREAVIPDLENDLDQLGFISWKADYDHLSSRSDFEKRTGDYRQIMKHSWMKTQFTLCPEYDDPRYGWYYAKEYGSIFFQNVQEALPEHLTMVPYHVLRQHWLMSKYFNGNKLQVMLQNPKRADVSLSDAYLHSHSYCFAMGLPFVPVFFQSAQLLDQEGQKELKQLISIYKKYREDMFSCCSFPVGDIPSNDSWAGFQLVNEKMNGGYILLFRELHNAEQQKEIGLKFLTNKRIRITNLESGSEMVQKVSETGEAKFSIKDAASYLFLKYSVLEEK